MPTLAQMLSNLARRATANHVLCSIPSLHSRPSIVGVLVRGKRDLSTPVRWGNRRRCECLSNALRLSRIA